MVVIGAPFTPVRMLLEFVVCIVYMYVCCVINQKVLLRTRHIGVWHFIITKGSPSELLFECWQRIHHMLLHLCIFNLVDAGYSPRCQVSGTFGLLLMLVCEIDHGVCSSRIILTLHQQVHIGM